ncbi:hypothetical protein LOAG_09749 [Loa loa]|uniref:Uncharacterized protein n=1 Tax=Loa loa TaxID=7209 RepID=A0A1S0TSH0_LOALO|nr:hypothetical protein LOAG_09749 [Loa loa]EFO18748.1 hypothetical protein LOAG_09749 [Loa loa]
MVSEWTNMNVAIVLTNEPSASYSLPNGFPCTCNYVASIISLSNVLAILMGHKLVMINQVTNKLHHIATVQIHIHLVLQNPLLPIMQWMDRSSSIVLIDANICQDNISNKNMEGAFAICILMMKNETTDLRTLRLK